MEGNTSTTLLPQIFECLNKKPARRTSYGDLYKEIRKFGANENEALKESIDNDLQRSLNKGKDLGLLQLNNGMIKMLFILRGPKKGLKRRQELARLQTSEPASLALVPLSEPPQKKPRKVSYIKSSEKLVYDFIKALCREAGKSNSNVKRK